MQLSEILKQPEGFCPPDVTVTIEKVFDYKTDVSPQGPWSFQDVQVVGGGRLKLKNILHEFPQAHVGKTVTIRANQSKQHGLTGLKVAHEEYQGKIYDKLIVTPSAKWEFGSANGNGAQLVAATKAPQPVGQAGSETVYQDHILSCAELAGVVSTQLDITDAAAIQACFATICIDTKNRNILLPKPKTLPAASEATPKTTDEPEPERNPFENDDLDDIPF